MSVTNVRGVWQDGNLVLLDKDNEVIATIDGSNREITIPSGSGLTNEGDTIVVTEPDDLTIEVDGVTSKLQIKDEGVDLAKLASDVTALLDIIANIPTADQEDEVTIWNDAGVLKVSSAGT